MQCAPLVAWLASASSPASPFSPLLTGLRQRIRHLGLAFTTRPSRRDWHETAAIFAGAGTLALGLGMQTRLVRVEPMPEPWTRYALLGGLLAVTPGISEELLFRGLLLPHQLESVGPRTRWVAFLGSLVAFVLWHPLNGRARRHNRRHVFTDHRFLLQTAILGSACGVAYLRSGSIWPPAVIHWLTVSIWILALGGHRQLRDGLEIPPP